MASDPAYLVTAERLAAVQRWFLRAGLFLLPLAYTWSTYDRWVLPRTSR